MGFNSDDYGKAVIDISNNTSKKAAAKIKHEKNVKSANYWVPVVIGSLIGIAGIVVSIILDSK